MLYKLKSIYILRNLLTKFVLLWFLVYWKTQLRRRKVGKIISSWAFHWNCEYPHLTFRIGICINSINHKNKIHYFNYLCLLLYFTIKFKIFFVMYWSVFPQNSYVEASAPKVTIFRDGALKRQLNEFISVGL